MCGRKRVWSVPAARGLVVRCPIEISRVRRHVTCQVFGHMPSCERAFLRLLGSMVAWNHATIDQQDHNA